MIALPETDFQKQFRERKEREEAEKERLHMVILGKTYKRFLSLGRNPVTGKLLKDSPYYGTLGRS
ncbi:MAG: hypothetical protein LBC59_09595 [Chitinispirillales bacterium]|jgi:hypothetical protein|nr:hypothetical protein [Chitinispirillales bacterium]